MALTKFEELKEIAMAAAEAEREALYKVWKLKKKIRAEAVANGESGMDFSDAPQERLDKLQQLMDDAMTAKENKLAASEEAQEARKVFNELMRTRLEVMVEQEV